MYYNVCPECGAHLDPGEPCDCKDEKLRMDEEYERMFRMDDSHQLQLNLEAMYEKTSA